MPATAAGPGSRALVVGVGGQDGALLARLLLDRGYAVFGTSRDPAAGLPNLEATGAAGRVRVLALDPADARGVRGALAEARPDEVYCLTGQSSVGQSFADPGGTVASLVPPVAHLLEALRESGAPARLLNAGSGECFGDTGGVPASERTPFDPRSPYAWAKSAAHALVAAYREAAGLHASTAILFNHESALRPARFVTRKVADAVRRIAAGSGETLALGDLSVVRDWGWAPEYVEALWRMLQRDAPGDLVIATGHGVSLEDFVAAAFASAGLDWRRHVRADASLRRPSEVAACRADPSAAAREIGWAATVRAGEVAARLVRG